MAVVRVFGTVNGTEVEYEQIGELWNIIVPYEKDEKYVVEIIAEDDAGNQSYLTKVLVVVNAAVMEVYAVQIPYFVALMSPKRLDRIENGFDVMVRADGFCVDRIQDRYRAIVMEDAESFAERRNTCSVLNSTWEKISMCGFESIL